MKKTIGAFEAKTKLPELLRAVRSGERFTITVRGEPVAMLGPIAAETTPESAVRAMLEFVESRRPSTLDLKALIEEGRD